MHDGLTIFESHRVIHPRHAGEHGRRVSRGEIREALEPTVEALESERQAEAGDETQDCREDRVALGLRGERIRWGFGGIDLPRDTAGQRERGLELSNRAREVLPFCRGHRDTADLAHLRASGGQPPLECLANLGAPRFDEDAREPVGERGRALRRRLHRDDLDEVRAGRGLGYHVCEELAGVVSRPEPFGHGLRDVTRGHQRRLIEQVPVRLGERVRVQQAGDVGLEEDLRGRAVALRLLVEVDVGGAGRHDDDRQDQPLPNPDRPDVVAELKRVLVRLGGRLHHHHCIGLPSAADPYTGVSAPGDSLAAGAGPDA